MSEPEKIVSIEELRKRAAARGEELEGLSPEALGRLAEELARELGSLPDVRMDKVALAKARISKGYYTGERIAEGLLDSLRGPEAPAPLDLPVPHRRDERDERDDERTSGPDGAEGNPEP